MDRCLRLVLALALAFGGFFSPVAMAHAKHHHAAHRDAAHACCDGVQCDCGCTMLAGAPVTVDVTIARLPPDLVAAAAPNESPPVPREPALRPPIR